MISFASTSLRDHHDNNTAAGHTKPQSQPRFHADCFFDRYPDRYTQIMRPSALPYTHGRYGRLWLLWALLANGLLACIMVRASDSSVAETTCYCMTSSYGRRYSPSAQRDLCGGVATLYAALYATMCARCRPWRRDEQTWGKGIYVCHVLWIPQIAWGALGAATAL